MAAIGESLSGNDEHQDTSRLQPTIGVAQKDLFGATAATLCRTFEGPIIGAVFVQKAEAFDRAMHLQRIALEHVGNSLPGLLGAVSVKLDAITNHLGRACDGLESRTITYARIKRRRRLLWKEQKPAIPPGFGQRQRKITHPGTTGP